MWFIRFQLRVVFPTEQRIWETKVTSLCHPHFQLQGWPQGSSDVPRRLTVVIEMQSPGVSPLLKSIYSFYFMSVCLSACFSVCRSVCLPTCPSICPFLLLLYSFCLPIPEFLWALRAGIWWRHFIDNHFVCMPVSLWICSHLLEEASPMKSR